MRITLINQAFHPDVVDAHPAREEGQRGILKINHGNVAAGGDIAVGGGDGGVEAGVEHGESVGKEDEIEAWRGGERRVVGPMEQADSRAERRQLAARQPKHGFGEIHAGDRGAGKAPGEVDQVPAGAAADLEDGRRMDGRDFIDNPGAAEEKGPAGGIIDARVQTVVAFDGAGRRRRGHRTSAKLRLP